MFDSRCGGDCGGQHASQRYRSVEVAHGEWDCGRAKEERRDREWQVLGAAFCQHNDTDSCQQYQSQDHASKVAGGERNSTTAFRPIKLAVGWIWVRRLDLAASRASVGPGPPNQEMAQGPPYAW